jgi:undecaprenyl diphosphate synthase
MKKNVRLTVIGDLAALPSAPRMGVRATIAKLRRNHRAQSQSGAQLQRPAGDRSSCAQNRRKVEKGELTVRQIDEELIAGHLQTHEMGDPDLLIRTSGEQRLSNFPSLADRLYRFVYHPTCGRISMKPSSSRRWGLCKTGAPLRQDSRTAAVKIRVG